MTDRADEVRGALEAWEAAKPRFLAHYHDYVPEIERPEIVQAGDRLATLLRALSARGTPSEDAVKALARHMPVTYGFPNCACNGEQFETAEAWAAHVLHAVAVPSPPAGGEERSTTTKGEQMVTDLEEAAWGLIANAGGGNWSRETDDWRKAAERWRDEYHAKFRAGSGTPTGERGADRG